MLEFISTSRTDFHHDLIRISCLYLSLLKYILLYSLLDLFSSTLSCFCTSKLNQRCRLCDMNGLSHCSLERIDVHICQIQVAFLEPICRNTVCLHTMLHLSWKLVACFDGLWRATTTNKFTVSAVQPPQGSLCIGGIALHLMLMSYKKDSSL